MKKWIDSKLITGKFLKIIFPAITMGVAIFFVFALIFNAKAAPASSIRLEPATATVAKDQSFSLDAKINPGTNKVTAVEMHVTFDATKFQITGVSPSSAFSSVLQAGQYDNTAGTASIIVGVPAATPPNPVTTDSTVATITLNAIGQNGVSTVALTADTKAAALNETGDVITSRASSQITIGRKFGNADFATLAADWLQTKTSDADVNNDGKVNTQDLGIMMSNWGG